MQATSDAASRSGHEPGSYRARLLAILTVVAVVAALKVTAPVTLPLAFAVFLIALFWPLQRHLEERMTRGPATIITLIACLVSLGLFVGALWWCAELVAERVPEYESEFRRLYEQARSQAEALNLPLPGTSDDGASAQGEGGGSAASALPSDVISRVADQTFSLLGGLVLVIAFFVLGLLEVRDFGAKIHRSFPHHADRSWLEPIRRTARDFQRYIIVRTGVGLITGVASGLVLWAMGLDFAFLWGFLNFILNYIPTLGSIIGVVPPVLFALVQYDGWTMPLVVLLGVGGVQLVMGNYVDPLLQGKYLQLSPLVVLLSVAFWGWLWGIVGAFIGVPLTVAIVIACGAFERTRPIAILLSDLSEEDEDEDGSDAPQSRDEAA